MLLLNSIGIIFQVIFLILKLLSIHQKFNITVGLILYIWIAVLSIQIIKLSQNMPLNLATISFFIPLLVSVPIFGPQIMAPFFIYLF